jgi:hypothetical protein
MYFHQIIKICQKPAPLPQVCDLWHEARSVPGFLAAHFTKMEAERNRLKL